MEQYPNSSIFVKKLRLLINEYSNTVDIAKKFHILCKILSFSIFLDIETTKKYLELGKEYLTSSECSPLDKQVFLSNLSFYYHIVYKFDKAIALYDKLYNGFDLESLSEFEIGVLIDYSGVLINNGDYAKSSKLLLKVEKNFANIDNKFLKIRLLIREGFNSLYVLDYVDSIENFLEALKLYDYDKNNLGIKDTYYYMMIFVGLGSIFESNNEVAKSIQTYNTVLSLAKSTGIKSRINLHYLNIGKGHLALDEIEDAAFSFRSVIKNANLKNSEVRASAYAHLGFCYFKTGKYSQAEELYDKAELIYNKVNGNKILNIAKLYNWRGLLHSEANNFTIAEPWFLKAFERANKDNDFQQLAIICKDISMFYAKKGDYKNAFEYMTMHTDFNESYIKEVYERRSTEIEMKYEAKKAKKEAKVLRLEKINLQQKALRAQMNPHFMSNALNAIQSLISPEDSGDASKYLAKFSKLMRQSLDYSEEDNISLELEVEFLENYLFINKALRFGSKLNYKITIDDEIEDDILRVPTMILQPYIENAIEHGIRTIEDGFINVSFDMENDTLLRCIIQDNGIGRKKSRELQLKDEEFRQHKSRGTSITERRLELLNMGINRDLKIETIDLVDESGDPSGTKVVLYIPVKYSE